MLTLAVPCAFYLHQGGSVFIVVCLSACLSVSNSMRKLPIGFAWNFQGSWQWANEQMIKFWWWSGSLSEYRDCFPDLSLLGDTESGISWLRCTTLQCGVCTSRHCISNYDVITSPSHDRQPWQMCLGGGMHCPNVSSCLLFCFTRMLSSESLHESVGRSWGQWVILPAWLQCFEFPSVLWRCWLGDRNGIQAV